MIDSTRKSSDDQLPMGTAMSDIGPSKIDETVLSLESRDSVSSQKLLQEIREEALSSVEDIVQGKVTKIVEQRFRELNESKPELALFLDATDLKRMRDTYTEDVVGMVKTELQGTELHSTLLRVTSLVDEKMEYVHERITELFTSFADEIGSTYAAELAGLDPLSEDEELV